MSFVADKKREHEANAETALKDKNYANAWFHTAKAAELGLRLAEDSEGRVAKRYVDDAFELIEIAAQLKKKATAAAQKRPAAAQVTDGPPQTDKPGAENWELSERPAQRLADVAGLDAVKAELAEKVIEPFKHPELFERFKLKPGGGVLMYGPPGNGKTFIARAVAGELDAAFFAVNAAQIKDKYVGETEKNLQRLFDAARTHDRAVLFLDEVDQLLGKRGNQKIGSVAQFLTLADGLVQNKNVMLILAATNKPWLLDEAVIRPGRLGTHIYVGPPDATAREGILRLNLQHVPVGPDVDLAQIAAATDGYSGADLAELCDRAKRVAKNRQTTSGRDELVQAADFASALQTVRPSINAEQLKSYATWGRGGDHSAAGDEE